MPIASPELAKSSLILQAGGVATSTVGSYYSALGQKRALQFQADIADHNALAAASAGTDQASDILQRGGQVFSAQRASMAANGVDITEGSPAAVLQSTDTLRQIDANTTLNNAMDRAFGFRTEAIIDRGAAKGISPAGAAFGTLLEGASKVGSKWARYNDTFGKGGKRVPTYGGPGSGDTPPWERRY